MHEAQANSSNKVVLVFFIFLVHLLSIKLYTGCSSGLLVAG